MKYGFGIDIGGTTVKLGFFTQGGELLEKWEIPTDKTECGKNILPHVAAAVDACLSRRGIQKTEVFGTGVGVPGPVDGAGVVNGCINLGWGITDVPGELRRLTGLPAACGNDANLAALGECWKGGGKGKRSLLLATLGTGIGGGIVLDGRILPGAHGAGGEIGHIPMDPAETEACNCGKKGCAEQYGSATALVHQAEKRLAQTEEASSLREVSPITAKDVFAHSAAGDPVAVEIVEEYCRFLGRFLAAVCCVVDPEIVVLGGGVSKAGRPLLEKTRGYFVKEVFHPGRCIPFALAELGNDAGIYGGMKLALDAFGGCADENM